MGRACVQGILARCSARERASDCDWVTEANGVAYRAFPDGMLAKRKVGDDVDEWVLSWCTGAVIRPVDRGPLADIECGAREVILFGPPGGPDDGSGPRVWRADEESLFATTIHGSFRLMTRPDGRGTLSFVRDDFTTLYLGDDPIDELRRTADRRLREHRGEPIRGWIAGRRIEFHGLGVGGVVGQVELMRGTWLFLVRAGDDRYDLYMVVGGCILDRVGSYTGSALTSGDLGQLFDRHDLGAEEASDPVPAAGQRPRRSPPHHAGAPAPHAAPAPLPCPAALSADQLGRIETCFSPTGPFHGAGASDMAAFYAALRELITLGLPNQRLKTDELQKLVTKQGKVHLVGCTRTFIRGAERVLEETRFGARDGHWWDLPFADLRRLGPVVDRICAHFESKNKPPAEPPVPSTATAPATVPPSSIPALPVQPPSSVSTAGRATSSSSPPPAPPLSSTQPSASSPPMPPASSPPADPILSSPTPPFASSMPAAGPLIRAPTEAAPATATPPLAGQEPRTTWTTPVPDVAAASPTPLIHASSADAPVPSVEIGPPPTGVDPPLETERPDVRVDPVPDELEDDGHWHPVIRRDGQPTFYEPLVPREESDHAPSRFNGQKPRGPPKT